MMKNYITSSAASVLGSTAILAFPIAMLLSGSASAQTTAAKTQEDYDNVLGWARSVAQIINSPWHKCISQADLDRIEEGYRQAIAAFKSDVHVLTGVNVSTSRNSNPLNYSDQNPWPSRVDHEVKIYIEFIVPLEGRVCGDFLPPSIQLIFLKTSSSTTVTSPTDKQKYTIDPPQVMLTGRADIGSWFVFGQATFAGAPHGNFSDVFPAFPAANTSATINSGQLYSFEGDGGYTLYKTQDFSVGVFAGYYAFHEFYYGMFPGFAAQFPLLSDQWSAGEGGVELDKKFTVGSVPFDLNITAAGLADHLRAGAFNGNGGGARANGTLSFPLGPVVGNIYAQYTDLNASGTTIGGVPLRYNNQNWAVGGGITFSFGGNPAASPASMTFKAPTK